MTKGKQRDDGRSEGPCYLTPGRPRCPSCGCPRFHAYRTVKNGTPESDDDSLYSLLHVRIVAGAWWWWWSDGTD